LCSGTAATAADRTAAGSRHWGTFPTGRGRLGSPTTGGDGGRECADSSLASVPDWPGTDDRRRDLHATAVGDAVSWRGRRRTRARPNETLLVAASQIDSGVEPRQGSWLHLGQLLTLDIPQGRRRPWTPSNPRRRLADLIGDLRAAGLEWPPASKKEQRSRRRKEKK